MTTLRLRIERYDAHVMILELRHAHYDELADKVAGSRLPFHANPWDSGDETRARAWHEQTAGYELVLTLGELAICDHVLKARQKMSENALYARKRLRQVWRRAEYGLPAPPPRREPTQLTLPYC